VTPRKLAVAVVGVLALAGCAGPSRTSEDYQNKAANTVEAVISAAQTARLAVRAQIDGKATAPYLSVILGEAEDNVGSVQTTFDSVQPPDARADKLRAAVDGYLGQADQVLSALRIAVRRGQLDQLARIGSPLAKLVAEMNRFEAVNG
jgi:hypothetical protein